MFVAELDRRGIVGRECRGRIDRPTIEAHEIAVALGVLVHCIEPERPVLIHGLADICRDASARIGIATHHYLANCDAVGFLEHAIDDATTAAATEDHRVRPLENLQALQIIEIAKVLNVVADAIGVEVRVAPLTSYNEIIAVGFTLMIDHARNVASGLSNRRKGLVLDELLGQDRDGLRHIEKRRVGFGRTGHAVGDVAHLPGPGILAVDARRLFGRRSLCGPTGTCCARAGGTRCRRLPDPRSSARSGDGDGRQSRAAGLLREDGLGSCKTGLSQGGAAKAKKRRLFGNAHGHFRTRGRNSSATA